MPGPPHVRCAVSINADGLLCYDSLGGRRLRQHRANAVAELRNSQRQRQQLRTHHAAVQVQRVAMPMQRAVDSRRRGAAEWQSERLKNQSADRNRCAAMLLRRYDDLC